MEEKKRKYTGSTLLEIFEELEGISLALEEGLSMLVVLEEAGRRDIDGPDLCNSLSILYGHLYGPARDLKSLSEIGRDLLTRTAVEA